MHLRDDAKGFAYLRANRLEEGKFICVIPRLRYTPYYRIRNTARVPDDEIKDAINERTTEKDQAKLREMIIAYQPVAEVASLEKSGTGTNFRRDQCFFFK